MSESTVVTDVAKPNTFQLPNFYVDRLWPLLSADEKDVLVYIARRIYGHERKQQDAISGEQFMTGIVDKYGQRLDSGTGQNHKHLTAALKALVSFALVKIVAPAIQYPPSARRAAIYALQLDANSVNIEAMQERAAANLEAGRAKVQKATAAKNKGGGSWDDSPERLRNISQVGGRGTTPTSYVREESKSNSESSSLSKSSRTTRVAGESCQTFTASAIRAACQCSNPRCECHRDNGNVHCPAHADKTPSLSVNIGTGGKVVWHCHANCPQASVTKALRERVGTPAPASLSPLPAMKPKPRPEPFDWAKALISDYCDEDGVLLFQVGRGVDSNGKRAFSQRQPKPGAHGGWIYNLKGARRVLYWLPYVRWAETVFVVEGEKCADALNMALACTGHRPTLVATTSPGGAGKWHEDYAALLTGKRVVVLPDNDEPGCKHAAAVCESLPGATIVELPGLGDKGDVADWLVHGGTVAELRRLCDCDRFPDEDENV